jgi:hypothetical protein
MESPAPDGGDNSHYKVVPSESVSHLEATVSGSSPDRSTPSVTNDDLYSLLPDEDEDSLPSMVGLGSASDLYQLIDDGAVGSSNLRRRLSQDIEDHLTRPLRRLMAGSRESLGSRGDPDAQGDPVARQGKSVHHNLSHGSPNDVLATAPTERPVDLAREKLICVTPMADDCHSTVGEGAANRNTRQLESANNRAAEADSRQIAEALKV